MENTNTIALCIPAYNAEKYLPRLLSSAKNQAIPFDEILLYNDCSQDNTKEIAEQFGITVINGKTNMGCSYGKNALAAQTTCNWIHFHDADDELYPNFTALAHKWINTQDCPDVVLFDYEYKDHITNTLFGIRHFNKKKLEADPISYSILEQINPFCGLYNRAQFLKAGGYDIDPLILYNEDVAFHIKLAAAGLTFSAEQEISIINYRISDSMSSANMQNCFIAQYHVLEKNIEALPAKYSYEIAYRLWELMPLLALTNQFDYVKKALKLCKYLGYSRPLNGSKLFKLLSKLNPYYTIFIREKLIRILKPKLRK